MESWDQQNAMYFDYTEEYEMGSIILKIVQHPGIEDELLKPADSSLKIICEVSKPLEEDALQHFKRSILTASDCRETLRSSIMSSKMSDIRNFTRLFGIEMTGLRMQAHCIMERKRNICLMWKIISDEEAASMLSHIRSYSILPFCDKKILVALKWGPVSILCLQSTLVTSMNASKRKFYGQTISVYYEMRASVRKTQDSWVSSKFKGIEMQRRWKPTKSGLSCSCYTNEIQERILSITHRSCI